ncbi:MAG: alpha/beta hydrolase-fold protein [Bacteroidota bacterium]
MLVVLAVTHVAVAQPASPEPLTIGDTFTLESEILGETRRINVYAPAAYTASDTLRLPVLYMPDGGTGEDFVHVAGLVQIGALNGTMQPHLLVGIENAERRRDLTGPTDDPRDREIAPRVGGSAAFRAFLGDELRPVIDAQYRTTGETAIVGESLAGLFVVETLLLEPDLFDTYIAIDPSLWWNRGQLAAEAASLLASAPAAERTLYLAGSGQPQLGAAAHSLYADLDAAAVPGLALHYRHHPGETHLSIYHPAALQAFRTVLGPASLD